MAFSLSSVPGSDDRPRKSPVKKTGDSGKALKERLRNALITGTAGGYLGGMLVDGKVRVRVPDIPRKLLRMKRKTIGIHGARTGALAGAAVGATNKGKRSETADAIGTGGDWKFDCGGGGMKKKPLVRGRVIVRRKSAGTERPGLQRLSQFSAYIEDMTFASLPKDVQADVTRFVDAAKGTPVVHYGMTVKELLDKADPVNLATARKNLGTLRASRAADEVIGKVKDGSKFILLMNDRIVDGHHFLAKAERGKVTSSLNVLDLTPARIVTAKKVELSSRFAVRGSPLMAFEDRKPTRTQSALIGAAVPVAAGGLVLGTRGGRNALRGLLSKVDRTDPRRIRKVKLVQKRKDASVARNTEKAVAAAREKFRAEALPKAPKEPGLVDAVKTVRKRAKKKLVQAVSNIGASPAETQMSQFNDRRSPTRELRDKIGLAKDVAGLGVTVGAGIGARKLYKAAQPEIKGLAKRLAVIGRTWHRAGVKAGKTLDTVKDAVAPAAATNRGIVKAGGVVKRGMVKIAKAAGLLADARVPTNQFQVSGFKFQGRERSKLEKIRDASLATAGAGVTGALIYAGSKAREGSKVADNLRNTTAIGADVGKVYRKARKVVTDSVDAFKGGMREAAAKPAPKWARKVVKAGKKLKLFSVDRSRLNQFGLAGAVLGGVGGLAGMAAGNKFRYPVQNALKKLLVPKLGRKWGRRVARSGAYLPEALGSVIGSGLGSAAGGGLRTRRIQPEEMGRVWNVGGRLVEFGGKEQLKDIDRGGFLDPLDVFVGRKRGYTSDQVKKYNRLKNYVDDVRSGRRKGSGATVASAESEMKGIRGSVSKVNHGQVFRSLMRKGDDVRRVTERGGGLAKDAIAHLRGDPRERDASGRQKKREWEKSWFQRTKNQVIAGAALGGGYMALKGRPKLRAKIDRVVRQGKRVANNVVPDFFPDVKPLRVKGQKTAASVQARQQQAAQAKTAKVTNIVKQAAQQTAAAAAAIPKKSSKPGMKKAASKPATAPKAPAVTISQSPSPPVSSSSSNPWAQSKIASSPPAPTAAEKAVASAAAKGTKKGKGRKKPTGFMAFGPVLFAFEKPFAGYNAKRHARTGGLNDSFRKAYNREHGSNLKRPVTTPPSKLKEGSEAAGRRKSFCARMGGMQGPTSKGGQLTPKGAALKRWNCGDARRLFAFSDDPLDVGWDLRDARGRSARVFAPGARPRDRREKKWHERIDNERKLWAAAGLAGTGLGAAATKKLMGNVLKRQAQTAAATAAKRAKTWKRYAKGERGKLSSQTRMRKSATPAKANIVPMTGGPGMAA